MTTQEEAIRILEDGYGRISALLDRLPADRLTEQGIGGDNWTAQDLIGHIAFWENAALEALDAWADGRAAPIDRLLVRGIDTVNRDGLRTIRQRILDEVKAQAARSHAHLILALQEMGPNLWDSPPTARHIHSIGESLGRILVGPDGPFTHANAHLPELEEFVQRVAG